jgi:hypothetical protein
MKRYFLLITIFLIPLFVFGAINCQNMDDNFKFAWGENIGWVNFNPTKGNVKVCDDEILGYAWSENYGWINLAPTNGGVLNDGNGNLSGYAWGENLGWINFNNVNINPNTGEFSGYAVILNDGSKINFDCSNCKVKTNWRKTTTQPGQPLFGGAGGGLISVTTPTPPISYDINSILNLLSQILTKLPEEEIIKPPIELKERPKIVIEIPSVEIMPKTKESIKPISEITFQIFPDKIQELLNKFTAFRNLFERLKIKSLEALNKLTGIIFRLPTIKELKAIPEEFVFAKLIKFDLDIKPNLIIKKEDYTPIIFYNFPADNEVMLILKPKYEVEKIEGELSIMQAFYKHNIFDYLKALISNKIYLNNQNQKIEFKGPNKEGNYIANFITPKQEGNYKLLVNIYYKNLASKKLDIEINIKDKGAIKEKFLFIIERPISNAFVYLYRFNEEKKDFELWNAKDYLQENPQITDKDGKYSFIVPEGFYYLEVRKSGYLPFKTKVFKASDGDLLNFEIELTSIYNIILFIAGIVFILILISVIIFRMIRKII